MIAPIVVIGFVKFRKSLRDSLEFCLPLVLILGGGVANLIDRIRLGYVVDFIDPKIWPAFDLADVAIVIGALILAWQAIRAKKLN
jgi:signal peptidase II